jgi:hypothetical protein
LDYRIGIRHIGGKPRHALPAPTHFERSVEPKDGGIGKLAPASRLEQSVVNVRQPGRAVAEPSIHYSTLSGLSPARVDANLDRLPLPIR